MHSNPYRSPESLEVRGKVLLAPLWRRLLSLVLFSLFGFLMLRGVMRVILLAIVWTRVGPDPVFRYLKSVNLLQTAAYLAATALVLSFAVRLRQLRVAEIRP